MDNKIKTIIIDDDETTLNLMRIILQQHCPEVTVVEACSTVDEAMIAINNYKPDLVFCDIEMPGMSGFEMIEKMGDVDFDVVFVTAHDEYILKQLNPIPRSKNSRLIEINNKPAGK